MTASFNLRLKVSKDNRGRLYFSFVVRQGEMSCKVIKDSNINIEEKKKKWYKIKH